MYCVVRPKEKIQIINLKPYGNWTCSARLLGHIVISHGGFNFHLTDN